MGEVHQPVTQWLPGIPYSSILYIDLEAVYTANNGFTTDGRFNSQVDASKGLSLVVHRDGANEQYYFHYFLIEFL